MNEEITKLEGQLEELRERVVELEAAIFLDEDNPEMDFLEAQYQQFAEGVRSRREGNA